MTDHDGDPTGRQSAKVSCMPSNLRSIRIPTLAVLACLALAALAAAEGAATANVVPRTTRSCNPPKYPGEGYFTDKIRATGVSCTYAKSFVKSFYNCRTAGSKPVSGRCPRVRGFSCTEKRNSIPTELNSRVTCQRGGTQRIVHTYQQNLV